MDSISLLVKAMQSKLNAANAFRQAASMMGHAGNHLDLEQAESRAQG